MSTEENNIDEVFQRIERRETKFRYRTLIYIAVLVGGGAIWLWYTSSQVKTMQKRSIVLENRSEELSEQNMMLNDSLEIKRMQVETIEEALHIGDNFKNKRVEVNEVHLKELSFQLGPASELFRNIKRLQYDNVQFSLNGKSPRRGFNSITMMSFVLMEQGLIKEHALTSRELMERLPHADDRRTGDIILYEAGYCMLYVNESKRFVIGMTPFGILEIQPDFAKVIAILRPNYRRSRAGM